MARIKQSTNVMIIPKGTIKHLSNNLGTHEIDCKCEYQSCHYTLIHKNTIGSFQATRDEYGYKVFITSGYRCVFHNVDSKGSLTSSHLKGLALDLRPEYPRDLLELYTIAQKHFDVVILNTDKGFIHCHNNF